MRFISCLLALIVGVASCSSEATRSPLHAVASQLVVTEPDSFTAVVVDLDAIYAANRVDARACTTPDERERYYDELGELDPRVVVWPNASSFDGRSDGEPDRGSLYEEAGIPVCEINVIAETWIGGPGVHWVFTADHDVAAVEQAVRATPFWSDRVTSTSQGDGSLHDWGAEPLGPQSILHPSGRGGQLYVDGSIVSITGQRSTADAFLDPESDRLLDISFFADAFDSLDSRDNITTVLLSNNRWAKLQAVFDGQGAGEAGPGGPTAADFLLPWEVIGLALAESTADEPITYVAIVHSTEEAAQGNANRLRTILDGQDLSGREWSELYKADDIQADGLVVTLTMSRPDGSPVTRSLSATWFGSGANPFAVELADS